MTMQLLLAAAPVFVAADGSRTALAARDGALLAWLALEGPTARNRMAQLLWPDSDAEAARNALRQRLFQLRRSLGSEAVVGSATLALAVGIVHDLDDADSVLGDAAAVAGGEFAAWLDRQRLRRRDRLRQALQELAQMAEGAREWADALTHAQELLALEPLSESAHRRVMRLHYLAGDRVAALLAFDRCEQMLKDEVGARPAAPTLALLDTIVASGRAAPAPEHRLPAAVLRPPQTVGREAERRAALAGWAAQQVLWVVGEAGMGKSRLLQDLLPMQAGGVTASARPGDAAVPYAALARLLRALVAEAPAALAAAQRGEVARLLPELASAAAAAAPAVTPAAQQLALQRGVLSLLRAARSAGVAALVLDDLHFADAASLEMLVAMTHADAAPGLVWAFACRPAEGLAGVAQLQDTLLEDQRLRVLTLSPLTPAQLQELVATLALEGVDAAALAGQLHRHTGGNPLFALETLRQAWVDERVGDLQLPRPGSVARLIERRLLRLSPAALRLARCAAVAGQDFSIELATQVLGVPVLDLADAWAELSQAQVLRDGAFAHDLIFDAVHASVPEPIARHFHGQIANFLAGRGGEPARLAMHWAEARHWPAAAGAYLQAAARAQVGARILDCAALLDDAARCFALAADAGARFDALRRRADVLCGFEFGENARQAVATLEAAADGELQRLQALQARLKLCQMRAESEPLLRLAPPAIVDARRLGQPELELSLALMLAYTLSEERRVADSVALLQPYAASVDALGPLELRFEFWLALAFALDYADRLRDALAACDRALALPDLASRADLRWQAETNRAQTLAKMGQVRAAAQAGDRAMQMLRASGGVPPTRVMQTQRNLAHRLRDIGHYDEALALLAPALEVFRDAGLATEIAATEHRLAVIYQHLGQPERALVLLQQDHAGLDPGLTVMRLVHRADVRRQLGGDGLVLLRQAQAVVSDPNDVYSRLAGLFTTWQAPPDEGEALGASLAVWAAARERFGIALAGHVRAAACGLALGAPARALPHVEAALGLAREHQPDTFYLPELWLVAARLFGALQRERDAADAAATGRRWVMRVHDAHVPAVFQHSFLQRNPVNTALLALRLPGR